MSAHAAGPEQAVVLAGGRGTRLRPITDHTHKGMVPFSGAPFLAHVVRMLAQQGIRRVLFLLGYLHDQVQEHFGDGSGYGLQIDHRVTDPDALTLHRVRDAWDRVEDTFLLLYCDNYWPVPMSRLLVERERTGAPCQVTVYANDDGYTRDSVVVEDGFCRVFDRTRQTPGLQGVEIGYAVLDKPTVEKVLPATGDDLFEQAIYPPLAREGLLGAYWTRHRYYSVGGHERLPLTEAFFAGGPAVLLDRDGTLNVRPPRGAYLTRPDDVRFLPGALPALRRLRKAGYRVFVLSNQAGIGRGVMNEADHHAVVASMDERIRAAGGEVTGWYHCPHDWDAGCECRKPAPGMLVQAQRDHHLDLTQTFFVGDDPRDAEAADAADCNHAIVTRDRPLASVVDDLLAGQLGRTL